MSELGVSSGFISTMGRTRFSEAGPRRPGRSSKSAAALAAKNGFDGLAESPWRKTPSIFKQPVTLVHTTSKGTTKIPETIQKRFNQVPHSRERLGKPQQVFWAKRLENMRCMVPVHFPGCVYTNTQDEEYIEQKLRLASKIESAVSALAEESATASFCSALHLSNGLPVTGNTKQSGSNPLLYINLSQPFVTVPEVSDSDVTQQERRVIDARKRLQELRRSFLQSA